LNRDQARDLFDAYVHGWGNDSFLAGVGTREVTDLFAAGTEHRYRSGAVLIRQNDTSDSLFLLVDGMVKVLTERPATSQRGSCPAGEKARTLYALRTGGDIVGEIGYFRGGPRTATVEAVRREVRVVRVPYTELPELVARLPRIEKMMSSSMSAKLAAQMQCRDDNRAYGAEVRLARLLVELVELYGVQVDGVWTLDIGLTQEEIGSWVDVARNSANSHIGKLRDQGILRQSRKKITVFDMEALRRRAGL
jgi:CRP/FNR family cyclic AMP-dependent transcriptional regulator